MGFFFPALDEHMSFVFPVNAGQNLNQGRFSCTVFAHQCMNLPFPQGKVHILQGLDTGEIFADASHLKHHALLHCSRLHFKSCRKRAGGADMRKYPYRLLCKFYCVDLLYSAQQICCLSEEPKGRRRIP